MRHCYPDRCVGRNRRSRWHQRAAAVSLIHSTRQHKHFDPMQRITEMLLASDDDMVQKGLGWLLREAAKVNPKQTAAYLMTIRERSPRLVLRTACETLQAAMRSGYFPGQARSQGRRVIYGCHPERRRHCRRSRRIAVQLESREATEVHRLRGQNRAAPLRMTPQLRKCQMRKCQGPVPTAKCQQPSAKC